jgi:hypothetical protein
VAHTSYLYCSEGSEPNEFNNFMGIRLVGANKSVLLFEPVGKRPHVRQ